MIYRIEYGFLFLLFVLYNDVRRIDIFHVVAAWVTTTHHRWRNNASAKNTPPTTDLTTFQQQQQQLQNGILQRQQQQRYEKPRTFDLSKFRWSVTELSSSSSSPPRDDGKDDDDSCVKVDTTKRHEDDPHHSHKFIALEWIQKFQHLLTLSFDPTSNKNTNLRQEEIQNSIRQVFVHTNKDDDEHSSDHIKTATTTTTTTPFWRDMMAFTWNIITLEGELQISNFLNTCTASAVDTTTALCQPSTKDSWMMDETKDITLTTAADSMVQQLEFWCIFHTDIGVGRAHVRLVQQSPRHLEDNCTDQDHPNDHQYWKAYTLLTTLQSLHNRPWNVAPYHRPITGSTTFTNSIQQQQQEHGKAIPNRVYWHDQKEQYQQEQQRHPYVVIIGGGQGGLSLAARLQHLQIPYVVYEMGTTVGTSWSQHRYPSLYLHDPVYYNHMPYIEFPKTWPIFCPRNKIANFMECYVQLLDLNVVCHTKVVRAEQNQDTNMWLIDIEQRMPSSNSKDDGSDIVISKSTIQCHHIVFATGNSSHPRRPNLKQSHLFRGVQIHSSQYQGGKVYRNKSIRHVIVVGSNNSALDICQDIWEQMSRTNGGTVETITMIQRTPGMVVSTQSVLQYGLGPLYAEDATLHHEEADIVATTVPYKIALSSKWKHVTQLMEQNDAKMLNDLQKAGYRLDNGPDGTGIFAKSATEGGGFYIDHGCAELIIRNDITIRFATVMELQSDSIVIQYIDDPTCVETLPADMIIYATGFDTMDRYVQEICGIDVSNRVGRTWGLGLGHNTMKDPSPWEGELRNMWKPTTVNGLWFQGGNLAQNRHYSRYLALQLAARYMGINPIVYGIPRPTPLKA